MRQCPVCRSETGDDPVCPVCGFDITCDYQRFPTLGADVPRDLKARAARKLEGAKANAGEAGRPAGKPKKANGSPVSLLSQKEIENRIFNRGAFAVALAFGSFFASLIVYTGLVLQKMTLPALLSTVLSRLDPERPMRTVLFLALLCLLCFILLTRSVKKMRPDEWVWKKQNDGKWIVLKKDGPGSGQEKKMLTALLLFYFGWMLGLDILYLDGFSKGKWKLVIRCLISCGGFAIIYRIMNATEASKSISNLTIIVMIVIIWAWLIFAFIVPLARILRLPPEFDKGEY